MKSKTQTLAQRREMLIERCSQQRQQLIAQRLAMRQSFGISGNLSRIAALVRENRLPLAGAALGLALIRPGRLLKLTASAAMVWKTWQRFAPLARTLAKCLGIARRVSARPGKLR